MDSAKKTIELPEMIPVLPVRNTVLFPNTAVPLIVGRSKSVKTVREAQKLGDVILVVTQKEAAKENPAHSELYQVGVICLISKVTQIERESFQLIVNGLFRFQITEFIEGEGGYLAAKGFPIPEISSSRTDRSMALANELKALSKTILTLSTIPGADSILKLMNQLQEPSGVADLACTFLQLDTTTKQNLLEMSDLEKRLESILDNMLREKERLTLQSEIQSKMMERLSKDQRDQLLREQIRTINEELGDEGKNNDDLHKRIEAANFPPEVLKVAKEEAARLHVVQRSSPEYHVIRTYLDWLLCLPWKKTEESENSSIDLKMARQILEEDHFGIEKVKNRIIQFLAVTKLKKDMKGPILCLAGPPGIGKTSIAQSIAKALNRNFVRISLGGVRDEAEIRGHRRTYIGALPGRIIQAMKRAQTTTPLILLDEIDKLGTDFRGDPSSALLEVLDPEQNHTFTDHYLDVPYDLSKCLFVTTANMLENIPPALRDRLEVIEMTSYTKVEKAEIAKRHLVPKVLKEHGMTEAQLGIPSTTLNAVIENYTREAGVRNLTRELAHLCRFAAQDLAQDNPVERVEILPENLEKILGPQKYFGEALNDRKKPGITTGLAWTPVGGEILHIEVTRMEGRGSLILTGQLGDVMKESAQIALSLLRAKLGKTAPFRFDRSDFHIHVPSGAIPKDGPSAGVALFLALASLVEDKVISPKLALTGEITLRGAVLPVGGIKEKVIAAHRAGIETILLPKRNQGDLIDVSPDVKNLMKFHFIEDVSEVLNLAGLADLGFNPVPVPVPITIPTSNTDSVPHMSN